jgi:KDO2-lipid IV(A) lauroyltransferase
VDGIEHLEAALADGHGALLWRMYFCSSHVTKQALADAGHPLVHLSTWSHGSRFDTALGLKVFAPAYIEAEVRHLKRRIVIPRDGSLGYLRKLLAHLNANDIVSIFGELEGRAATSVTVFGRELQIASGTPSLARRSGAAMLPTYTERIGPDVYRVVVEEPIVVDPGLARREFVTAASREFASRLEEAVRRHPASWNRWEAD